MNHKEWSKQIKQWKEKWAIARLFQKRSLNRRKALWFIYSKRCLRRNKHYWRWDSAMARTTFSTQNLICLSALMALMCTKGHSSLSWFLGHFLHGSLCIGRRHPLVFCCFVNSANPTTGILSLLVCYEGLTAGWHMVQTNCIMLKYISDICMQPVLRDTHMLYLC